MQEKAKQILIFPALLGLILLVYTTYQLLFTGQTLPPNATPAGFVVHIPQRGYMRSRTTILVEAVTGEKCELIFITPDGVDSQEEGLGLTTADENGICMWNFVIEASERRGSARLLIYINGISETHFMELRRAYYPY